MQIHQSSSEEEEPNTDFSHSDFLFLQQLNSHSFRDEHKLNLLTRLIHDKIERIALKTEYLDAFRAALKVFIKVYWRYLSAESRLANPIADVMKAVLYYKERTNMPWIRTTCEDLDLERRFELVGFKLDAMAEEHQLEIDKERNRRKREKEQRKRREKTRQLDPPPVNFEDYFGPFPDFPH